LSDDIKRPLQKLMECKFTTDGKYVICEGKAFSTNNGEQVPINEEWSLSDILHTGADILSMGLDFVIPGSGAVVDILNAVSYIIEGQFKGEKERDSLYLMALITFGFVLLPGPLQSIATPLKRAIKTGTGMTSKVVIDGLKIIGGSLDTLLVGIPSQVNSALKSPLAKNMMGKWSTKISGFITNFTNRIKQLLSKLTTKTYDNSLNLSELTKKYKPNFIEKFGQKSYDDLLQKLNSKQISKKEFIEKISKTKTINKKLTNFVSKYGIKFSKEELQQIHSITSFIKKLSPTQNRVLGGLLQQQIRVLTKNGYKDITIKYVTSKKYGQLFGENFKDSFGGALGNKVYVVIDNVKKMNPNDIDQLFYHEFAHIKDPSRISPKLNKLYNPDVVRNSKEYFSKGYYFHPREIVANTSKILNGLSTNTNKIMKQIGKERSLKGLDDLVLWAKGTKKEFTEDMSKLIGYDQPFVIDYFKNLQKNPNEYKKLLTKIAQQSEYLKSQVKLSF